MRLVVVAGPPSAGKTAVVWQAIRSLQGGHRIAYLKIDVVRAFEDEELATEFGIPARKVYSGDLCPDHAGVMVMRDAIAWAGEEGADLLLVESAGLCLRCSPYTTQGLGTAVLPVVAAEAPANLTIVCLDNGAFGSAGNQPTPASGQVDMELLALAAGIRNTCKVQNEEELVEAWESRGRGPNFIHVVLRPGNAQVPNIPLAPAEIRERFMQAIGG